MSKLYAPNSAAGLLCLLQPTKLALLTNNSSELLVRASANDWQIWGREEQRAPDGDWRTWLFLGGRGAGKTRAGAEWVDGLATGKHAGRIALIGPTFHDVREVMIEGNSGLRSLPGKRPIYEPSRKRLVWENGAQAFAFSAEDPESLRGPQFDAAWGDELCAWAYPDETLSTLSFGLRLGERPRLMVTTTPRPIAALKALIAREDTALTRAGTFANRLHVSKDFIAAVEQRFTGTALHRQELLGELIEDVEGALWRRAELEELRVREGEAFDRIVVAVDPPASGGTCGVVAAGCRGDGVAKTATVLADASIKGAAPHVWAKRAAVLARSLGADAIVAEANNGGEMVRSVLKAAAPDVIVRLVHAAHGKRARAEPIAALYAQGRVKHAAAFPALEDEMCAFGGDDFRGSPDRVDALVWALTDLLLGGASPRLRVL